MWCVEIVNTIIQFYLPFILGGLVIAVIVLFVLCIILFLKIGRERKRYDIFMGTSRRPDHNLEMKINTYFETVKAIEKKYDKLLDMVTDIDATASENIQKIGLIRYNPFDEMGGNLCFALALLDAKDNGIVLNGIHSRTGSFTYAKPIEMGVSTYVLSTEEIQAVKLAQETAHKQKAEKVVKVKPKKLFKRKDKPLFEQENKKEEKIGMIGDVTTDESASIMAEEEIAQQISENTVVIKNQVEIENIKETVKELVKETVIQMEKETIHQDDTAEKVRRLEEQILLLTEKKADESRIKKYHRPEPEPFQTEKFKIITEIEKLSQDSSNKEEQDSINAISDSVENIIEQIAQKTQQKQFNQTQQQKIEEKISVEQEIQIVVQKAMENAVEKEGITSAMKQDNLTEEKNNKI